MSDPERIGRQYGLRAREVARAFATMDPIVQRITKRIKPEWYWTEAEIAAINSRAAELSAYFRAQQSKPSAPECCPYCNAALREKSYVPTLGNQVEYWCGRRLNDNGGTWKRDWTKCND